MCGRLSAKLIWENWSLIFDFCLVRWEFIGDLRSLRSSNQSNLYSYLKSNNFEWVLFNTLTKGDELSGNSFDCLLYDKVPMGLFKIIRIYEVKKEESLNQTRFHSPTLRIWKMIESTWRRSENIKLGGNLWWRRSSSY